MRNLTATVRVGRRKYEATVTIPRGATADPHLMEALKNRLRLMIASEILGDAPIRFRTENAQGELRRVA